MAIDTPRSFQQLVLYSIYVRNHGPSGTFADVEADLPRISSMGVDIIWFMPIHPIGKLNKKGSLGCPYSIQNYRKVNPEYGTKTDFARLIKKAHKLGMKVMIDVVYNHTSHDSVLLKKHPEWFHQDKRGKPVTTVPEWSDVIDLMHWRETTKGKIKFNKELQDYLVKTLVGWAKFGVDGFRCDVASLVPLEFWQRAREEIARVKPGVIWLAESVHASFVEYRRAHGLPTLSDSEVFQAFDILYDYDIWTTFQEAVLGTHPVKRYLEMVRFQNAIYPENFIKMRCVENHDQRRIMSIAPTNEQAKAWTAFEAFNKGAFLIYAGQESGAEKTPSLFDIDKIKWENYGLLSFLTALCRLKRETAILEGRFVITRDEPFILAAWMNQENSLLGIFNTSGIRGDVEVPLPDGVYNELLTGGTVSIKDGVTSSPDSAYIIRCQIETELKPFYSELLDFHLPPNS